MKSHPPKGYPTPNWPFVPNLPASQLVTKGPHNHVPCQQVPKVVSFLRLHPATFTYCFKHRSSPINTVHDRPCKHAKGHKLAHKYGDEICCTGAVVWSWCPRGGQAETGKKGIRFSLEWPSKAAANNVVAETFKI